MYNRETVDAVSSALSPARMRTYESASATACANDPAAALVLYAWNAEMSSAFLAPLHVCEVVVRNAVSDALELVYGPRWPWSRSLEISLPAIPRNMLTDARAKQVTTGKVIPELTFVFWQKMLTARHDNRIWCNLLYKSFPNLNHAGSYTLSRDAIYADLERIRQLRNRIAHHEPIFKRNLAEDYSKIVELVGFRCQITAAWLHDRQRVTRVLGKRP